MRELIRRSLNYSGNLEIVKMWQGELAILLLILNRSGGGVSK